jgi:hypothetical protein
MSLRRIVPLGRLASSVDLSPNRSGSTPCVRLCTEVLPRAREAGSVDNWRGQMTHERLLAHVAATAASWPILFIAVPLECDN